MLKIIHIADKKFNIFKYINTLVRFLKNYYFKILNVLII